MSHCTQEQHQNHQHQHGSNCGHIAIVHNGHIDYLHDGHLHHPHDAHVDEHVLEVSALNPVECTPAHDCQSHASEHQHGEGCGHEQVRHGDHICYLVDGHLHYPHGDHCDDHGKIELANA